MCGITVITPVDCVAYCFHDLYVYASKFLLSSYVLLFCSMLFITPTLSFCKQDQFYPFIQWQDFTDMFWWHAVVKLPAVFCCFLGCELCFSYLWFCGLLASLREIWIFSNVLSLSLIGRCILHNWAFYTAELQLVLPADYRVEFKIQNHLFWRKKVRWDYC